MRLGTSFVERYDAPYATVHRADLHGLLLRGAQSAGTALHIDARVATFRETADAIRLQVASQTEIEGDALVGADGLWSEVRKYLRPGAMPRPVGHLAYRALLAQHALPASLRSAGVTVWLGARLHVVAYPVRQDAGLNVVAIVDGALAGDGAGWDHAGSAADLQRAMGSVCNPLRELVQAASSWRLWVLNECDSVSGPEAMARGRLALLGDAAHPMRPYLAQGAGMAIEDAQELGRCLALERDKLVDVPVALQRYALNRWERVARVQHRAQRNGSIFHATGPVRWGRDAALRLLGERLLDLPWLYGHGQI